MVIKTFVVRDRDGVVSSIRTQRPPVPPDSVFTVTDAVTIAADEYHRLLGMAGRMAALDAKAAAL